MNLRVFILLHICIKQVDKNPPVSAGDTDSIPGPGRSHMLRGNQARVPRRRSLHSGPRALKQEAATVKRLHAATGGQTPLATARESLHAAVKTQHSRNRNQQ